MDYEALHSLLPRPTTIWSPSDVQTWLNFVYLHDLAPLFTQYRIDGARLTKIDQGMLQRMGIRGIIQRKIMRWVRQGFDQYQSYLNGMDKENMNKENIPPFTRKTTTIRSHPPCLHYYSPHPKQQTHNMLVRSCDGNLAAFYLPSGRPLTIGRGPSNSIRSLQVSVHQQHAQVFRMNNRFFIRDKGTPSGTFIKIIQPKILQLGCLVQLGSLLMQVVQMDVGQRRIVLKVQHMSGEGECWLQIILQGGCSSYSFGRRRSNNFHMDDQHLSGIHCKIYLLRGQFVLQDLHSTNGTWLRLNRPHQPSSNFMLQQGNIFKIGTTITYQCEVENKVEERMEVEYDDSCMSCGKAKRNVVIVPCRHNLVCEGCAFGLEECPMCREPIQEKIKIYI